MKCPASEQVRFWQMTWDSVKHSVRSFFCANGLICGGRRSVASLPRFSSWLRFHCLKIGRLRLRKVTGRETGCSAVF
jgi:hypothetical protein